jgi:NAD(P)-dependent dehydrogenase (short-subunit alcohol dehydrogenase family)
MIKLTSFSTPLTAVIIGASGGIGSAFVNHLKSNPDNHIFEFSRSQNGLDFNDEDSIEKCAAQIPDRDIDIIIIATGYLGLEPEKSLKDLSHDKFQEVFTANTYGPALVMKHFAPKLARDRKSVMAALSARVGSIGDNNLGGWYAYRASKAALNMVIRNTAIEIGRTNKNAAIIGLHPGTVDTKLSEPFQGHVPSDKLFTPDYAAEQMLNVMDGLTSKNTGHVFDYAGNQIEW